MLSLPRRVDSSQSPHGNSCVARGSKIKRISAFQSCFLRASRLKNLLRSPQFNVDRGRRTGNASRTNRKFFPISPKHFLLRISTASDLRAPRLAENYRHFANAKDTLQSFMQKNGPNCRGTAKLAISSVSSAPVPKRIPQLD